VIAIAGCEIGMLGQVLLTTTVALYQVMRPVGSMGPRDFRLSGLLKKNLDCRRFAADAYVKQAVICCPQILGFNLLNDWTQTLVPRRYQCLNVCRSDQLHSAMY